MEHEKKEKISMHLDLVDFSVKMKLHPICLVDLVVLLERKEHKMA